MATDTLNDKELLTERQLLELAANAAKIPRQNWDYEWCRNHGHMVTQSSMWNPLTDDGDALRLAVKLGLWDAVKNGYQHIDSDNDLLAAARRAIVRAAAEIGKNM